MSLPFRIYDGEANNKATKVFGGRSSGIRDLDDIKYPQMLEISESMFSEYWIEHEIKLGKDRDQWVNTLTDEEKRVYSLLSAKLAWMDSIATDFNFLLFYLCTDSSVRSVITLINSFEVLHNRTYQYLNATVLSEAEKDEAFKNIQEIPEMIKRNKIIIEPIQAMVDGIEDYIRKGKEIDDELLEVIIYGLSANSCLEGLFFSGAFMYFHSLARDQKMLGSNQAITSIKEDETQHTQFYLLLFQIVISENPQLNTQRIYDNVLKMFKDAVEAEKEWAAYLFKDTETLTINEYNNYIEYLMNFICRGAGLEELFPDNTELKSKWVMTYGSKNRKNVENEVLTRTDFLQANAINYEHEDGEDFDL